MDYKTLCAMAGENARETAWEIWRVILPDGKTFEVSGEIPARDWVKDGGECHFTGKYEAPSIT